MINYFVGSAGLSCLKTLVMFSPKTLVSVAHINVTRLDNNVASMIFPENKFTNTIKRNVKTSAKRINLLLDMEPSLSEKSDLINSFIK